MKRYSILTLAALAAGSVSAQNLVDAVRFGSTDLMGSARYRSMAGAFGALGGDPSCMGDNPAGLAIYRGTNVLTFTPDISFTGTDTKGSFTESKSKNNLSVANMSAIFSFRTPQNDNLVNFNLGVGFERRQNNFRDYNVSLNPTSSLGNYLTEQANNYLHDKGYYASALEDWSLDSPLLSLLAYDVFAIDMDPNDERSVYNPVEGLKATQAYRVREKNRHDEYNFSGSFNFNDRFYLGFDFKITDFNSTIQTQMDEYYPESPDDALYYDNALETKGSGVGVNVGLLWKPLDQWRIGAAVHTPTWMEMKEIYSAYMETEFINTDNMPDGLWCDYQDSWDYEFSTPWEYQISTAYIFGSNAILSLEWDMRDFRTMKYEDSSNYNMGANGFKEINEAIEDRLQMQHTIKVGAEYRINQNLSARLGYAYMTSPYKKEVMLSQVDGYNQNLLYSSSNKLNYSTSDAQQYVTGGLGWRGKNWNFDLACIYQNAKEYVSAYPADYADSNIIDMNQNRLGLDFTLGYRF